MKNLLELVQDYQDGGEINPFDETRQPTQESVLTGQDIYLTDDKYSAFLPTYDQTGEQFAIDNYILGREGLYSGAQDALSTAGVQQRQMEATRGFAGSGTNLLDTTRSDIVGQFGREGQRMLSGLQQDIYGQRRNFQDQLISAVGDLDPEAYTLDMGRQDELERQRRATEELTAGFTETTQGGSPNQPGNYDGETQIGSDGVLYRYNYMQNSWTPIAAGDVYGQGAYASGGGG
jgi:hypothetical protein